MKASSAVCPECGTDLVVTAHCGNPDCPSIVRERIRHWCGGEAMNIAISHTLIDQLVARGLLLDVADLYRLRWSELRQFEGMNEASVDTILASIEGSKSCEWHRILSGLEISGVDANLARSLAQRFAGIQEVAASSRSQLLTADGVTDETVQSLTRWFNDSQNRKLIKRLHQAGLNLG